MYQSSIRYGSGFDITDIIDKYKGKELEDLFENKEIITNGLGEFLELTWECEKISSKINLQKTKKNTIKNLKTVYNIGKNTERQLKRRGVKTLFDLKGHLRFGKSAREVIQQIKTKNFNALSENRYLYDLDTSFCFNIEDLLFIDLETLGVYDSQIIIVGIGYYDEKGIYQIKEYFARTLEEEIAICDHLRNEVLPLFKCFVSYNGKSFDIPFLANRYLYYFDDNPMITENDIPYKDANTKFGHIDLYHNCRRMFKGDFPNYQLTTIEEELLHWERENELPSYLVGMCYRKYMKDSHKYIGLIKEIIDHNYFDIYSMPLILNELLKI
ncbi:MAG: hypothetical protein EU541_02725 [Promethearchaeota archaeon]|nr:MAG: hypothetical protein EU541_02725 [Candidatus Lokiarchaeota archaeon]